MSKCPTTGVPTRFCTCIECQKPLEQVTSIEEADEPEFGDYEPDEREEDLDNCHGWFDDGRFVCGAVGSEDCDECPCNDWLGLTSAEIDALEPSDE